MVFVVVYSLNPYRNCRRWLQAAGGNKMLMRAATVVQVLQDYLHILL